MSILLHGVITLTLTILLFIDTTYSVQADPCPGCEDDIWASWSFCNATTCGGNGFRVRTRILVLDATWNTSNCDASPSCRTEIAPCTCNNTSFGAWGNCNAPSCNSNGSRTRTRDIGLCNPEICSPSDTSPCRCQILSVGDWSQCSASQCNQTGTRNRTRSLQYCSPAACSTEETSSCRCDAGDWGQWSECTAASCDSQGNQTRTRIVSSCADGTCHSKETRNCTCNHGTWGSWSYCSASVCDSSGTRVRSRSRGICSESTCSSRQTVPCTCSAGNWTDWPPCPAAQCDETRVITRTRNISLCNPLYCQSSQNRTCTCRASPWSTYSDCLVSSCNTSSISFRTRSLTDCSSSLTCKAREEKNCSCVADNWGAWSSCSASICGGSGTQTRSRMTSSCPESACTRVETRPCQCTDFGWSDWGQCIGPVCNGSLGVQTRTRMSNCTICQTSGQQECNCTKGTPSEWNSCSSTCAGGMQTRTFPNKCSSCNTKAEEVQSCGCSWGEWEYAEGCRVACGTGSRQQRRRIGNCHTNCPKPTQLDTCTTQCSNGGTNLMNSCACRPGYHGRCCEYGAYTSCKDALVKNNLKAGTYDIRRMDIDPDRIFRFNCSVENGNIVTTILVREPRNRDRVNRSMESTYTRTIEYQDPLSIAFIGTQSKCRQLTTATCSRSVFVDTNNAALKDKNGNELAYWGGGTEAGQGCACGASGLPSKCHYTKFRCNCDANVENILVDTGYVTDKSVLPITGVVFKNVHRLDGWIDYTIGNVECYEPLAFEQAEYRSCKDALVKNLLRPNIYQIKPSSSLATVLVHCSISGGNVKSTFFVNQNEKNFIHGPVGTSRNRFTYLQNGNVPSISAIVDASTSCSQQILIQCRKSAISTGGFTDRNNQRISFQEVACNEGSCSCDGSAYFRTDSKVYTDKTKFPLTSVTKENLNDDWSWFIYRLGNLECTSRLGEEDNVYKTCEDALKANLGKSGQYLIKPDMITSPILVHCKTDSGVITTSIMHDKNQRTYVSGYGPPGSYRRTLLYVGQNSDIEKFIDNSYQCRQRTTIECVQTRFIHEGYAWLQDRSQQNTTMWGGGVPGGCKCRVDGTCESCNCNVTASVLATDDGYFSDKSKLPITALFLGGTANESSQYLYYTIGFVECRTPLYATGRKFTIRHGGADKFCVTWDGDSSRFVLKSSPCDEFRIITGDRLQHVSTSNCVRPLNGMTDANLTLTACTDSQTAFEQTTRFSLKHKPTGKCLNPLSKMSNPASGTIIVNGNGCDEGSMTVFKITLGSIYQNCEEALLWEDKLPSGSGIYTLRSSLIGNNEIRIHCSVKNGKVISSVPIENPNEVTLKGPRAPYSRSFRLDRNEVNILNFIDRGTNCRQYLKYKCRNSTTIHFGKTWLVDRHAAVRRYMGGAAERGTGCKCGLTNSCQNRAYACNCDAGGNQALVDEGYLNISSHLPITQIFITDLAYPGQEVNYTMGNVECEDGSTSLTINRVSGRSYNSCIHALAMNEAQANWYLIQPPTLSMPIPVRCHVSGNDVITSIVHNDNKRNKISFQDGRYLRNFTYFGTWNTILEFIKETPNCRQLVSITCRNSSITDSVVLKGPSGKPTGFLGGAESFGKGCICGMSGKCDTPTNMCNCDSKKSSELSDVGYITNGSLLPITAILVGGDGRRGMGRQTHEISNVECYTPLIVNRVYRLPVPSVSVTPGLIVNEGDDVTFTCSLSGSFSVIYTWLLQGNNLLKNTSVYQIKGINRNSAGSYFCRVIDARRFLIDTSSAMQTIFVRYLDNPELITTPATVPPMIRENTTFSIICKARTNWNPVTYIGFRNTLRIYHSTLFLMDYTTTIFQTNNIKRNEGGSYRCQTENTVGSKTVGGVNFVVSYIDSPVLTPSGRPEMKENVSFSLVCTVFGFPAVSDFTMYLNDNEISKSSSRTWSSIPRNASGAYHCCAQNFYGKKCSTKVNIIVRYMDPPRLIVTISVKNGYVLENTAASIRCAPGNNNVNVLLRGYRSNTIILQDRMDQRVLDKNNVLRNDSGLYWCETSADIVGTTVTERIWLNVTYHDKPTVATSALPTIKENRPLTLTCIIDSYPTATIVFRKHSPSGSMSVVGTSRTMSWGAIKRTDSGIYECCGTNPAKTNYCSDRVTVDVQYLDQPTVNSSTPAYRIKTGSYALLNCDVQSNPPPSYFRWYQGKQLLVGTLKQQIFDPIGRSNDGDYLCQVANSAFQPKNSSTVSLTVIYLTAPTISPAINTFVWAGSDKVLRCAASGTEEVKYTWYRSGIRVPTNLQNKDLVVANAKISDDGNYSCKAENEFGQKVSTTTSLSVYFLGQPMANVTPQGNIFEGNTVHLTCQVQSKPPATYRWEIPVGSLNRFGNGSTHTITSISRTASGSYRCQVSNGIGPYQANVINILVQYLDDPVVEGAAVKTVHENQTLTIKCFVNAVKAPTYTWRRHTPSAVITIGNQPTYSFNSINRTSSGNYSCLVTNAAGSKMTRQIQVMTYYIDQPTLSTRKIDVIERTSVSAVCTVNSLPSALVTWHKGATTVSNTATIEFSSILRSQAGLYYCSGANVVGRKNSAMMEINVCYLDTPTFQSPIPRYVIEGNTITMTCRVTSNPSPIVVWYRNGTVVTSGTISSNPIPDGVISTYTIEPIQRSSTALYRCGARNSKFSLKLSPSRLMDVAYLDKPNLTILPSASALEGSAAVLTCNVNHNSPITRYVWRKNNVIMGDRSGRTLPFNAVTRADAGSYQCSATNHAGSKASDALSFVIRYIDTPTVRIVQTGPVAEGRDFTLICGTSAIPASSFKWYKDGEALSTTTVTLSRTNVTRSDSGSYTCEVSNSAGTKNQTVVLDVTYLDPPQTNLDRNETLNETASVNFTCSARSFPLASITWFRNGFVFKENSNYIYFASIKRTDAGRYVCTARNTFGIKNSTSITVIINYLDTPITSISNFTEVKEGDNLSINCQATSFPAASFKWTDLSNVVVAETSTVTWTPITRERAKAYRCCARNARGHECSEPVQVVVKYMDTPSVMTTPRILPTYIREGTAVSVVCVPGPHNVPLTYLGYHNGVETLNSRIDKSVLSTTSISREAKGVYHCAVSSTLFGKKSSSTVTLSISYQDSPVISPSGVVEIVEGRSMNLTCQVNSFPSATLYWHFINLSGGNSRLETLSYLYRASFMRANRGHYMCCGNNTFGVVCSARKEVNALYIDPASLNTPSYYRRIEGESVELRCNAISFPAASIIWYKNTNRLTGTVIRIAKVSRGDGGLYRCDARNPKLNVIRAASTTLDVVYLDKPSITPSSMTKVGDNFTLQCTSLGNPQYNIVWFKDGNVIPGKTKNNIVFQNISKNAIGTYHCVVNNTFLEKESDTMFLNVAFLEMPRANITPTAFPTENTEVCLQCFVNSNPSAKFRWVFNSRTEVGNSQSLCYASVKRIRTGSYTCTAMNSVVGTQDSNSLQMTVQYHDVPMISQGSQVTAIEGDNLSLQCQSVSVPSATYVWYRMELGMARLVETGSNIMLRSIKRQQGGYYLCSTSNIIATHNSSLIRVDVQYLDTPTTSPNISTTVIKGSNLEILCAATGNPPPAVSWFKSGQMKEVVNGSRLMLSNIEKQDAGNYTCLARNNIGSQHSINVTVDVLYLDKPVAVPVGSASVISGNTVELNCISAGNPQPQIAWFRNGQANPVTVNTMKLVLANIKAEHAGGYYCAASNTLGRKESSVVNVIVYYLSRPMVTTSPVIDTTFIKEGSTLNLSCTATSSPVVQYQWKKNSTSIAGATRMTYRFLPLKRDDTGIYVCQAMNSKIAAKLSDPLSINVSFIENPQIQVTPSTTIKEGAVLLLVCSVNANPATGLRWYRNNVFINHIEPRYSMQASRSHAGSYSCEAKNVAGTTRSALTTITVTYLETPSLSGDHNKAFTEGSQITIKCSAVGQPTVTFSWYKQDVLYKSNNDSLTFTSLNRQDASTYYCSATNSFGTKRSAHFSIKVQYLDRPVVQANKNVINETDTLTLTCTIASYPNATVEWIKEGMVISNMTSLEKVSTSRMDAGKYTCRARNLLGIKNNSLDVIVHYLDKPAIRHELAQTIYSGSTISLECYTTGFPQPVFIWRKGVEIISNTQKLVINKATSSNNGNYRCEATNDMGTEISSSLALTVTDITCDPNPCKSGGVCDATTKSCKCNDGFTGPLCEGNLTGVIGSLNILEICDGNNQNCVNETTVSTQYTNPSSSEFQSLQINLNQALANISGLYSNNLNAVRFASIHADIIFYFLPSYNGTLDDMKKLLDKYIHDKGGLLGSSLISKIATNTSIFRGLDECALSLHKCSSLAKCVDTSNSYSCECLPDYIGDGFSCALKSVQKEKRKTTVIVVGTVAGAFFLLILIFIIICMIKRKRESRYDYNKRVAQGNATFSKVSVHNYEMPSVKDNTTYGEPQSKLRARFNPQYESNEFYSTFNEGKKDNNEKNTSGPSIHRYPVGEDNTALSEEETIEEIAKKMSNDSSVSDLQTNGKPLRHPNE